jgi:hypothetical protein
MKNTKLVETFADLAVAITTVVCARSSRKGFDMPDRDMVDSNDIVVSEVFKVGAKVLCEVGAKVLSKVGTKVFKVLSKDERDLYETVDKEYCVSE